MKILQHQGARQSDQSTVPSCTWRESCETKANFAAACSSSTFATLSKLVVVLSNARKTISVIRSEVILEHGDDLRLDAALS